MEVELILQAPQWEEQHIVWKKQKNTYLQENSLIKIWENFNIYSSNMHKWLLILPFQG